MCHGLLVVAVCELGVVMVVAVVSETVPVGVVVVAAAPGAVVVGAASGAVVVGADPAGEVVDVAGARTAGEADLSAAATTTPREVLAPCCGRLPIKLASGCWATASTPVIIPTAIPKAATAATATRRQRGGRGRAVPAPSSLAAGPGPTRRSSECRARVWADASERAYRASPKATRTLPSAAPMRVPSTPKKDAATAAVTAASAPASNLATRSCSIPHLQVGVGGRRRCRGNHRHGRVGARRHLQEPASYRPGPSGASWLPRSSGGRAVWARCRAGDQGLIAALLQRAGAGPLKDWRERGRTRPERWRWPTMPAVPKVSLWRRAGPLSGSRLTDLPFPPMPAMADNRVSQEGGAMPRLDDTAVEEGLQHLPGWERRGDQIVKTFAREDFTHAMVFVNEVADAAEAAGHHPDIDIRWNKVTLTLSSHVEGGLTDRDFQLAARIQELDQPTQPA
jgi:4a-hydroxytetrahydrobiopterin dehydratase